MRSSSLPHTMLVLVQDGSAVYFGPLPTQRRPRELFTKLEHRPC